MQFKFSVVVTAYNCEKTIQSTLANLRLQDNKSIEFLIINDGSTDNTNKKISKYKNEYPFFKYINHKKNKGIGAIRNESINKIKGDFLLFVDADDNIEENGLKIFLKNILKYPNTDLFFLNYTFNSGFGKTKILRTNTRTLFSSTTSWQYIYRKNFLKLNNIYFSNVKTHEDWLFIIKCLLDSPKKRLIKKPFYYWNKININSLGRNIGLESIKAWIEIIFRLNNILKDKKNIPHYIFVYINKFILLSIKNIKEEIHFLKKKEFFIIKKFLGKKIFKNRYLNNKILNVEIKKSFQFFKDIKKSFIKNDDVAIFCAGSLSEIVINNLLKMNTKIRYIFDNNKFFLNQKISGIDIKNINSKEINLKSLVFIICNINKQDIIKIKSQLVKKRIKKEKILVIQNL
jgi:glycosyltransferase involved in cell wall biosynthesis